MNITQHFPRPRTSRESETQASLLASVLDEMRDRRAARAADRRLRQELAAYDTPASISDLMAAVERQDGPEAEHVRAILSDNMAAYHSHRVPAHH